MRYSEDLVEEIRSRNDIVDVISNYVQLKKKGNSHFGLCPFHNEKSPSFSVSQAKQMFYCFGCGAGGNVISFVMKYENDTFQEALALLANRAGIELPEGEMTEAEKKAKDKRSTILQINKDAARFFFYQLKGEKGATAYHYLRGRELSDETILKFGLGYAGKGGQGLYHHLKQRGYSDSDLSDSGLFTFSERGVNDKFWNRVMFPIMDANSRVIGFGGRVMGDGQPKYLNSPETIAFDKSRNLYGLHVAKTTKRPYLILCEGYMDVIAMHQAGFSNAVASLGTAFTSGQASLIKRYTKEVILSYDSDGAGVKAALRAIPILRDVGLQIRVLNLRPYKDPDEFMKALGRDAFEERLSKAENAFLFEVSIARLDYDLSDPAAKTAFYQKVTTMLVESFSDDLERMNYLEAVCAQFQIPVDLLKSNVVQKLLTFTGVKEKREAEVGSKNRDKKKTEDGVAQSQKLLLTWLIDSPQIYPDIKGILSPEEFSTPLYRTAAGMLFEQFESGNLVPAKIINHFEEEDEQKEIASLFQTTFKQEIAGKDKEKAFHDLVYRVKKNYIEQRLKVETDPRMFQSLVQKQMELAKLRIHFHCNL